MKTLKIKKTMKPLIAKPSRTGYFPGSIFDEFFAGLDFPVAETTKMPSVNVKENDNAYELEVQAPGLTKEAFNVEVENDMLVISAEAKHEEVKEGEKYTRKEFSYQSFKRSFRLPEGQVDLEKIDGKYEHGILRITLPKLAEEAIKATKRIAIG
jgi:HSP20 family protein